MGLKLPIDRFLKQADSKTRAEHINNQDRPFKGTNDDILNFKQYFEGYTPKEGTINGPELKNSKVYISIYHFLEYEGSDPNSYDTEKIGLHFYNNITQDTIPCYYEDYSKKIDKYEYSVLKNNFSVFEKYLK